MTIEERRLSVLKFAYDTARDSRVPHPAGFGSISINYGPINPDTVLEIAKKYIDFVEGIY